MSREEFVKNIQYIVVAIIALVFISAKEVQNDG